MLYPNLDSLEEPILITGHVSPDPDVISSAVCLLNYFSELGKDAYYIYLGGFPENLRWCLKGQKVITEPDIDYKTLIVLDCLDDTVRIGFEPRKDIRTIVFDHHRSSFSKNDNNKYFVYDLPSTSSIFSEVYGIKDPIIYVGLFYDSILFNARMPEAAKVLLNLNISNEEIQEYHLKMTQNKDLSLIETIRDSLVMHYEIDDHMSVVFVSLCCGKELAHEAVSFFHKFADVLCMFNETSRQVHLRSRLKDLDLSKFSSSFGKGGGHKKAAGFLLPNENEFGEVTNKFMQFISKELANESS